MKIVFFGEVGDWLVFYLIQREVQKLEFKGVSEKIIC